MANESMIERVARAICLSEGLDPDFNYDPNGLGTIAGNDVRWKFFVADAKYAIEAMREPTEVMLDAYWLNTGESKEMRIRVHSTAVRYFKAMIDAALQTEIASPND